MSDVRTEAHIQREIVGALEACGALVIRMNAGRGKGYQKLAPAGTPDLLVIGRHHLYWVEVKTATGQLRPEQVVMHERLRSLGQTVIVARSIDDLAVPV